MAEQNPTGSSAAVTLKLSAGHIRFLRELFGDARAGVSEELADYPDGLRDPGHLRREDAVYGQLLVALDELMIVPDTDMLAVVADLAQVIDGGMSTAVPKTNDRHCRPFFRRQPGPLPQARRPIAGGAERSRLTPSHRDKPS